MATITPVAFYSGGTSIDGTTQVGNLNVGTSPQDYGVVGATNGIVYYGTPDQDLGYIIAHEDLTGGHNGKPDNVPAYLGFFRSTLKTEESFIELAEYISIVDGDPQVFSSGNSSKTWLTINGYWTSYEYQSTSLSPTDYDVASLVWPIYTEYNTSVYVNNSGSPFNLYLVNSGYTVTSKQTNFLNETKQTAQDSTGRYLYYGGSSLKKYDVESNTVSSASAPGGGITTLGIDYDQSNNYLYAGGFNVSSNDNRMYRFNSNLGLLDSWVVSFTGIGSVYGVTFNPNNGLVYYGWGNDYIYSLNPSNGSSSLQVTLNSRKFGRELIVPETNEMYYRGTVFISGSTYRTSICVINLNDNSQTEYDVQLVSTTGSEVGSSAIGIAYDTLHNLVWYKQPNIGFKGIDVSSKQVYVTATSTSTGTVTATINNNTNELVTCYTLLANKGFEIYDLSSL